MPEKLDYKKIFTLGTIFIGAGVALFVTVRAAGIALFFVGGLCLFVGGRHHDEWHQK
ncbi:MAG: hypothetical protein V1738_04145 [Patescibacteria group bacterium]